MEYASQNEVKKLAVCYPGESSVVFMAFVEAALNLEHPDGYQVRWFRGNGWCQARRRIHAAEKALAWGADLICTLDIDQVYEPDVLCRLVARIEEGYPMVAAMVPMRGYVKTSLMRPFQRLAWRFTNQKFVPVNAGDGDMQQCEFPTSACMIFKAEDLQKVSKPWYFFTYKPDDWSQVQGEDSTFALRFQKQAGVQAWVDTTILVKHAHVFAIDETFSERFKDWSESGVGDPAVCSYEVT